jgi:ABC-type Fe3+/spermidine/putrescine transport system ATPase subunit
MVGRPALGAVSLRKEFGGRPGLLPVTFSLAEGEHLAVTGPSGSGKSTLLRLLAGLIEPSGGSVVEGDRVVNGGGGRTAPHRRSIGMVFQGLALWPHRTLRGHVELALRVVGGLGRKERRRRVSEVLGEAGLSALADRFPGDLSGGEKQRAAWARAIAARPRLLLLDEPLTALDPALREDLLLRVERYGEEPGRTVVIVTHDHAVADRIGRRTLDLARR